MSIKVVHLLVGGVPFGSIN